VKMATVKHQPTFEILPSEAGGCLVVVIWPKGPEQQLDGFASVEGLMIAVLGGLAEVERDLIAISSRNS